MKPMRPRRLSLLSFMALVALVAVWLGWIASDRRKRVALLNVEFRRMEDRLRWAERMQRRGYVSRAALIADRARLKTIETELTQLGATPKPD